MAAVSHLELEFLSYWTTHEVHYAVRLPGQNFGIDQIFPARNITIL